VRGPGFYDPQLRYPYAKARQEYVLDQMVAMGKLTPQEAAAAKGENIQAELKFQHIASANGAPHFVNYVIRTLENQLGPSAAQSGDLKVYTTLDNALQAQAMKSVSDGVSNLSRDGVNNGALRAATPARGEVLAWA